MNNYTSIKKYKYICMDTSTNMLALFLYIYGAFCRVVPKIAPSCVETLQYQRCIIGIQLTCMVAIDILSLGPCLLGRKNSTERYFSSLLFCRLLGSLQAFTGASSARYSVQSSQYPPAGTKRAFGLLLFFEDEQVTPVIEFLSRS